MDSPVLVTGGTGFIGRFVVRQLLRDGNRVRILCRSRSKAVQLFGDQVDIVVGNLLDTESVSRACADIHTVIHIGGAYCFGAAHRKHLMEVNVQGTRHLLIAASRRRVEKIVHVSSASLLQKQNAPAGENDFVSQPAWCGHYKRSKWAAEICALQWARRGLPLSIASLSSPVGPEDETPTPTGRIILDFLQGRFPFLAHTGLNFIPVRDCADGILAVARNGANGSRYLITGRNLWLGEFLGIVSRFAKRPAPRWTVPWPLIALAGLTGEILGRFSGHLGQRICWETAYFARRSQFFNPAKTREELGWTPVESIESAVQQAVEWFCPDLAEPGTDCPQPLPLSDVLAH